MPDANDDDQLDDNAIAEYIRADSKGDEQLAVAGVIVQRSANLWVKCQLIGACLDRANCPLGSFVALCEKKIVKAADVALSFR